MAHRQVVTVKLAAANAAIIAASQTPVSGTALALVGGGTVTLDTQRRVLVTYGNEASARTLVITGTNGAGLPIKETVAIPSGSSGTAATLQDFLTVSSAVPLGGGWTAAMTVGTNGVASSPWQRLSEHSMPFEVGFGVVPSGTVNCKIEYTLDSLEPPPVTSAAGAVAGPAGPSPNNCTPFDAPNLTNISTNTSNRLTTTCIAWRLTQNSFTSPGFAMATGIQSGIRN